MDENIQILKIYSKCFDSLQHKNILALNAITIVVKQTSLPLFFSSLKLCTLRSFTVEAFVVTPNDKKS